MIESVLFKFAPNGTQIRPSSYTCVLADADSEPAPSGRRLTQAGSLRLAQAATNAAAAAAATGNERQVP